jgi:hypothetical protein
MKNLAVAYFDSRISIILCSREMGAIKGSQHQIMGKLWVNSSQLIGVLRGNSLPPIRITLYNTIRRAKQALRQSIDSHYTQKKHHFHLRENAGDNLGGLDSL